MNKRDFVKTLLDLYTQYLRYLQEWNSENYMWDLPKKPSMHSFIKFLGENKEIIE